jgi:hypothetical protein
MQDTVSTQVELAESAAASSAEAATAAASVEKEATAAPLKVEKSEAKSEEKKPAETQPPNERTDWMMVIKERDFDKVKQHFKGLTIDTTKVQELAKEVHAPSVALGAATSAAMLLVLMFATSRR